MPRSSRAAKDAPAARGALEPYRRKRDFSATPEPAGGGRARTRQLRFVIQKHWASRLHYDFRLEFGGTMKSWAVPKGPSFDPADKRMAVQVEDHPISYNSFEGQIPAGNYGAGRVIVWDSGTWTPLEDPAEGFAAGKLKFRLTGHKLQGAWTLVRMHGRGNEKQPPWLLIKERDEEARPRSEFDVTEALPDSVLGAGEPPAASRSARSSAAQANATQQAAPSPAALRKLPKTVLPEKLQPQLATLVERAPAKLDDWLFELKFDGYRMLARLPGGRVQGVQLWTRNGHDWTERMPELARDLKALGLAASWLDGEVVVPGEDGAPDFQALQNAFDGGRTAGIVYYVFDLPFHEGRDLRSLPLVQRRALLQQALGDKVGDRASGRIRLSEAFEARPEDLVSSACKLGFEGVIGKRREAAYASRRNADWIKLKCSQRQEFVVGGYTDPKGSRKGIGSLLLGVHDEASGKLLRYVGNVGTGFSEATLARLHSQLAALASDKSPFANTKDIDKKAHWVRPKLIAEVAFADWTDTQRIRHSVFHGLRGDKPASAIVREQPEPAVSAASAASLPTGLRVTHPERVIDPSTGTTKLDLVRHYATVAPLMLEHLKDRPVSLVRAPRGIEGEKFFQKHHEGSSMPGVRQLDPKLDPGHSALLEIDSAEGLLSATQMNVVEFHTWNAREDRIEKPDRMTFDIDPGEGVAWEQVQQAAELVRVLLQELGLPAFLKTSGGKGLHVVVPLKRLLGWDAVKDFSQEVVQHLARTIPERFVSKSGPRNRVGRIFVDYLRNGRGATTAAAWTARARPGMGVSVPVAWEELPELTSGAHWTVRTIEQRLRTGNAPWKGYASAATSLSAAMKALRSAGE